MTGFYFSALLLGSKHQKLDMNLKIAIQKKDDLAKLHLNYLKNVVLIFLTEAES